MTPKYLEKIAIVGAGGRIGTHITQTLLATGKHTVTAITRAEQSTGAATAAGSTESPPGVVRVVVVDYNNQASLVEALRALRRQHCLVITLGRTAAPHTQSQLVRAAAAAGVPYVIPNLWGYDTRDGQVYKDFGPMALAFTHICDEIESLGVSKWIGIANGFWYEFSLGGSADRFGFDFTKRTLDLVDDGARPVNTTTFAQVGRAVAALLSLDVVLPPSGRNNNNNDNTTTTTTTTTTTASAAVAAAAATAVALSKWDNNLVFVSSFRVSQWDMFASVKRVTGTSDEDWVVRHETHRERYEAALAEMRKGDVPSFVRAMYTRIFFPDRVGDYEGTNRDALANGVLGLPEEDLDEATKIAVERGLAGVL